MHGLSRRFAVEFCWSYLFDMPWVTSGTLSPPEAIVDPAQAPRRAFRVVRIFCGASTSLSYARRQSADISLSVTGQMRGACHLMVSSILDHWSSRQ